MILYNANRFNLSGQYISTDIRWRQLQCIKADVSYNLDNKRKEKNKINKLVQKMQQKYPDFVNAMLSDPKSKKALEKYIKYVMIDKK